MKIITTPMCEDVLEIAGIEEYEVVTPDNIENADVAILLSETRSSIPKISIKLNTFTQLYDSVMKICEEFDTVADENSLSVIRNCIIENDEKKDNRKDTKVRVYSNFLRDTILDMGYTISSEDYDYIVIPDYMDLDIKEDEKLIIIPSHRNVSARIIERIKQRYTLLENKLCMKH